MIKWKLFKRAVLFLGFIAMALLPAGTAESRTKYKTSSETIGPGGETPTSWEKVTLNKREIRKVRKGNHTAAILMHSKSDFTSAVIAGAKQAFSDLNIKVILNLDAQMSTEKQMNDVEIAVKKRPDIILSLVLDPITGAVAFQEAVDKGIKLVFISNVPAGFTQGQDYEGIVTDDLFGMGSSVAEMMGKELRGRGDVALLYHDASYYVTNQRDQAVKTVLQRKFPRINILHEKGIANPNNAQSITAMILELYPELDAIYAPWDTIAEGVVKAARAAGNKKLKVFTMDLGVNNALDLVKRGNMAGVVADLPYVMGQTLARMGARGLLGKSNPPFVIVPAIKVDRNNIAEKWQEALNKKLPEKIRKELR